MLTAVSLNAARGDRPIFIGLNLCAAKGQALHVIGPNGSGKSTLLRVLGGLMCAESGQIFWQERTVAAGRALPDAAYLGHRNGLKMELTPLENLRSIAQLHGYAFEDGHLLGALEKLGMRDAADEPTGQLSQGQQRRVALARVLSSAATLWLLDEPTTALDQASIHLFESICEQHLRTGGMLVFANHQPLRLSAECLRELSIPMIAHQRQQEVACLRPCAI